MDDISIWMISQSKYVEDFGIYLGRTVLYDEMQWDILWEYTCINDKLAVIFRRV